VKATTLCLAAVLQALAALLLAKVDAAAQFDPRDAIGQSYRVEPSNSVERFFNAVLIERVAPHATVIPPPLEPLAVGASLRALTGQIHELPERQRLYFAAVDARGVVRLFEIDLLSREARQVVPPVGAGPPYAVHMLVAPEAAKLYVQWFRPAQLPETDIYDGATLNWLGRTAGFRPDERAAGFEHREPYLWTLDLANRPVLVDSNRDQIVRRFDYQRWFGPVLAATADAWRDLLLVRLDVGHDRFQVVDVLSGEIGPPLDLQGYALAQPRLALDGRLLVLIEMERRPLRSARWSETAIATGRVTIFNLRDGQQVAETHLVMPRDLPVAAVGSSADPGLPTRLWVHVPGDAQRFDFDLPACQGSTPRGDVLEATLAVDWHSADGHLRYRYRVSVAPSSDAAAGALAIQAGQATDRTAAPHGWGVDLISRDRWVRWTNALGPPAEDIGPGTVGRGFVIAAHPSTRPGIAEYRIQAAFGLPRGCQSDDRFLTNSLKGHTVAPERVNSADPRKLAQRLQRLVDEACEIGWIETRDCGTLQAVADSIESAGSARHGAVDRFLEALANSRLEGSASAVLANAALAIRETVERSR